eukprot:8752150-Ditylum_brightwellii.AAC.1
MASSGRGIQTQQGRQTARSECGDLITACCHNGHSPMSWQKEKSCHRRRSGRSKKTQWRQA